MQLPITYTYNPNSQPPVNSFFVLNRGYNAGKPLKQPCPNCFVVVTASEAENSFYYWLCWALWQAEAFKPYLHGSVIDVLRIGDFNAVLAGAALKTGSEPANRDRAVITLQDIAAVEAQLNKRLQLYHELKRAICHKVLTDNP